MAAWTGRPQCWGRGGVQPRDVLAVSQMRCGDRLEREEGEESEGNRNSSLQGCDCLGKEMGALGEKAGFLGKTTNLVSFT